MTWVLVAGNGVAEWKLACLLGIEAVATRVWERKVGESWKRVWKSGRGTTTGDIYLLPLLFTGCSLAASGLRGKSLSNAQGRCAPCGSPPGGASLLCLSWDE
jgi:hypothetical protein